MNQSIALLTHALRMLVADPAATLRVILPALICVLGAAFAAVLLAGDTLALLQSALNTMPPPAPGGVLIMLVCGLVGLAGYVLLAILWHRYVLLDSPARTNAGLFWGYVWRAVILGFVQFIFAIPIGIAIALLTGISSSLTAQVLIGLLAGIAFLWIALRLSLVLPAAALGHIMPVRESWKATEPLATPLWGLAVLIALINGGLSLLSGALLPDMAGPKLLIASVFYIAEGLVFISVLTTLYGHLIQGRALS